MANRRRNWSEGSIVARGPDIWRVRYWFNGKRHSATIKGSKADAREALRNFLHAGDTGQHIDPSRMSLTEWVEHWLELGAPGRKGRKASARTLVRYASLLRTHILPKLGQRRLQEIDGISIDDAYGAIARAAAAPRTQHHAHVVLRACLDAAVRSGRLVINPVSRALQVPRPGESDHGIALSENQVRRLVDGFRGSSIELIVTIAAQTGMRRNEILGLQWNDLDPAAKTINVERAIDKVRGNVQLKPPKTKRGFRTVAIDDGLVAMLVAEREKYQRLVAGISDKVAPTIDLKLVRLPDGSLMFPSPLGGDLKTTRDPDAVTRIFQRRAKKLGFGDLRLHDLRGSHGTNLLRRGVPVDVVARRLGHDPVTLLRAYAKPLDTDSQIVREALRAMSPAGSNGNGR
jgi:integrase